MKTETIETPPLLRETPRVITRQCTAKSKRTHNRCMANAMRGTTVCYHHGGKGALASRGKDNGNYKHGENSRYSIPAKLKESYEASLKDESLLEMRQEISIIHAFINDSLKKLDTAESGDTWDNLHKEWTLFVTSHKRKDAASSQRHISKVGELITKGVDNYEARKEIRESIDAKKKLVDSEVKRQLGAQEYTKNDRILVFLDDLMDSLRSRIKDKKLLQEIIIDFQQRQAG